MTHTAILGPGDQPNGKIEVRILRPHDMAGFFLCEDEHGKRFVIHAQQLRGLHRLT